jgi:two-component system sensor histidine kinase CpxA
MRFPLTLKVSLWLLLNLLLLTVIGVCWMLRTGGNNGITWTALVAGPSGRSVQALAEVTMSEIRFLPRPSWEPVLQSVAREHGVQIAVFGRDLYEPLGGDVGQLPDDFRERILEMRRPAPGTLINPPPPQADILGPPRPAPPPLAAAPQAQRLLLRTGDPAAYWLNVPFGTPGRPRETFVIRAPSLWRLLALLDLDILLWLALAAVVCSILLWLPFVAAHTRALRRLGHATESIADGRFDTRVPENSRDELGALGGSINRMSGRLERLVAGQKRFLGDIAHELGSPLGRMQMGIGILEARAPAELQPAINDVREEVVQMADLVAELLAFTRAGLRPRDAARARVELADLASRVLAREAAADAVTLDLSPHLAVLADADLLNRALANLVRNALRYAGRSGTITLSARRLDAFVEISVEDNGPGVPPEALERLGEPFFRPETARQRETGGVGLGLAIVRGCAEACGGTVHFANRSPRGFSATLRIPAAD